MASPKRSSESMPMPGRQCCVSASLATYMPTSSPWSPSAGAGPYVQPRQFICALPGSRSMTRRPPEVMTRCCAGAAAAISSAMARMTPGLNFVVPILMCGVFGIVNHKDAANLVYLGLYALQHRGQESAGIASISSEAIASDTNIGDAIGSSGASEMIIAPGTLQIHSEKEMGYVADIFTHERLARLPGDIAIGHVRYSTAGGSMLCNAQPLVASTNKGSIAIAHNGNLVNGAEIRRQLEEDGAIFNTMADTEVFVHLMARSRKRDVESALVDALIQVKGAYSIAVLTPRRIYAARDPYGFRPLVLGKLNGALVVASETCAFDLIGAEPLREIAPGEIVALEGGSAEPRTVHRFPSPRQARCIFEHVYFARPDSVVFGRNVAEVRKQLGRELAREDSVEADLVVPVPDSGVFAALGYAQASGLPFEYGL